MGFGSWYDTTENVISRFDLNLKREREQAEFEAWRKETDEQRKNYRKNQELGETSYDRN